MSPTSSKVVVVIIKYAKSVSKYAFTAQGSLLAARRGPCMLDRCSVHLATFGCTARKWREGLFIWCVRGDVGGTGH